MAAQTRVAASLCLFCMALPAGSSQGVIEEDPVSLLQTSLTLRNFTEDPEVEPAALLAKTAIPQEVMAMRRVDSDPVMLALSCTTMSGMVLLDNCMQDVLVGAGAHELAISAMRRFPDDISLQVSCSNFLAQAVQWKAELAAVVGPAGAIDVMVAALRRHPEEPAVRGIMSNIGSLCDSIEEDRVRVNELGGIELALQIGAQYPLDAPTQQSMQCFFSTQCGPSENTRKMLQGGYIPRSVQTMRDLPRSRASGEAIFIFNMCFSEDAASLASMVDAGLIDQIPRIILAGLGHFEDLDPIRARTRVPISANVLMSRLAGASAAYRDALVRAGAVEAVRLSMEDVGASKESMAFGGKPWDALSSACAALTKLSAGSGANLAALRRAGVVGKAQTLLKTRGPSDPAQLACGPLLAQ